MPATAWIVLNLALGLPLALVVLVIGRETLRAGVALALGFRVFEIQWGVGRRVFADPVGPIDFAVGALPLAGATVAASGSPQRHRPRLLVLALSPLITQLAGFLWLPLGQVETATALSSGWAIGASFGIANLMLIALHTLFPIEWSPERRTDIRAFLDAASARASDSRHARADYYARVARHALERADVATAIDAIEQGRTQLGREGLLVECGQLLESRDLDSVVDQGDCADALLEFIEEHAQALRSSDAGGLPAVLRRAALHALPITCALIVLAGVQRQAIAESFVDRWVTASRRSVERDDATQCSLAIQRATGPAHHFLASAPASLLRDRHELLARLEACRGNGAAAAEHQIRALAEAEAARALPFDRSLPDRETWLSDELQLVALLRLGAELHLERDAYRRALASLGRADQELMLIRQRTAAWPGAEPMPDLFQAIELERIELEKTRHRTRTRMAAR